MKVNFRSLTSPISSDSTQSQLKKRNQKLVQEYCGATLDNVIVKNVRSSRSIETRAQPKVQLELEKPTTLYDNMQFDDKISPVIVLH